MDSWLALSNILIFFLASLMVPKQHKHEFDKQPGRLLQCSRGKRQVVKEQLPERHPWYSPACRSSNLSSTTLETHLAHTHQLVYHSPVSQDPMLQAPLQYLKINTHRLKTLTLHLRMPTLHPVTSHLNQTMEDINP
jgi:hypothetical protein